jgi:hypothetical protein
MAPSLRVSGAVMLLAAVCGMAGAQEHAHHPEHLMQQDAGGMVMNANDSILPRDCPRISRDYSFEIEAGTEFAKDVPGTIFGYSRNEFAVEPCSRITVTLINRDEVRHQWMVHGLPRYLYAGGMFHLEAAGGSSRTGTFILPSDSATYLVHCDLAQHMEKGMKAQLKVGRGSEDLSSIPGVSADPERAAYLPGNGLVPLLLAGLAGLVGFFLAIVILKSTTSG